MCWFVKFEKKIPILFVFCLVFDTLYITMKLMGQIEGVIRAKRYSRNTEKVYTLWIKQFLRFHRRANRSGLDSGWVHPREIDAEGVEDYLTHLAVKQGVAPATQNQALNAIVFLYKHVLKIELGDFNAVRAKRRKRVPVVLFR